MSKSGKIKVEYKKLKAQSQEILTRVNEVYKVETRYAIILAIRNFGSCNIKKLAKILGKNEATIYHHLKYLTRVPELLIIDNKKTRENRGIYYKLSKIAELNFGEPTAAEVESMEQKAFVKLFDQTDEEIAQIYMKMFSRHPDLGNIAEKERRSISYNRNLENIMLNNMATAETAFKQGLKPKNDRYPIGTISNFPLDMKISKPRHLFQILNFMSEMTIRFAKLKAQIAKDMGKENTTEDQMIDVHYHIVGGEVAEFEFE